ncbi:UMP kinase [Candidatus Parcubacteria bacterium 4484_255]|nr:MAG: UMP kinase [Candidatus Parcubacteria bacterium 4484_255]
MGEKDKKTLIFSLGGSLIIPSDTISVNFLKKFKELILKFLRNGYRIILITGGGGTNRKYNAAAQKIARIKDLNLDWLGIAATKLNAEFIRCIFGDYACPKVLDDPNIKVDPKYKLIIASGWKPGCSSDKDAVLWAKNLKAKVIFNLSDVDFVYDKDPDKFSDAKPLRKVSWSDFIKIVGKEWSPRKSVPFGPPASLLAKRLGLEVVVLNGKNIKNLENYLNNKKFKGTIIN